MNEFIETITNGLKNLWDSIILWLNTMKEVAPTVDQLKLENLIKVVFGLPGKILIFIKDIITSIKQ